MFKWIWLIMLIIAYICCWIYLIYRYIQKYKAYIELGVQWKKYEILHASLIDMTEEFFTALWIALHIVIIFVASLAEFVTYWEELGK